MQSTPSFDLDDKLSAGILLVAVLLFSWFSGVKNLVIEWTGTSEKTQTPNTPNVLMIVVDDLGYDDTSAINTSGLPTPNITQLAHQGVTFRRHYADSTCTPSRVAMLTGRYAERSGFRPVGIEIPTEFPTIAQRFEQTGYTTYLTGKWHAGEATARARPENKGFENWFGFLNQFELSGEISESEKGPSSKPRYHNPMLRVNGGELRLNNGHLTDILTDHTIEKIKHLQAKGAPWFLYHAFLAPHSPIQPAKRYEQKFPATPEGKYAALVTQLDDAIGRILDTIDTTNTLVVFVSDNGGTNRQRNNNFPYFGAKNQPLEGAYRTPLIFSWPGVLPTGKFVDDVVMNVDIYPTLLEAVKAAPPEGIDGKNLWNLMLHDVPLEERTRSWEGYHPNINTLSFSLLSRSGKWRLSSRQGTPPLLFDLLENPAGDSDVASTQEAAVSQLTAEYWRDHWDKSRLPVSMNSGARSDQMLYSGFDVLRTPNRYGFAIGLEVGPLPAEENTAANSAYHVLAGQEGSWELRYRPDQGLEWRMHGAQLRDPHFDPARCNAIVLTGYFQPLAHLAKIEPVSPLKLYSSGFLRDALYNLDYNEADVGPLHTPTFVNFHGKAIFSSVMLNSFSDNYSPRAKADVSDTMTTLYKEKKLTIADVSMMDAHLCK